MNTGSIYTIPHSRIIPVDLPIFGEISSLSAYQTLLQNVPGARLMASGQIDGLPRETGFVFPDRDYVDPEQGSFVFPICQVPGKTGIYHVVGGYQTDYILGVAKDQNEGEQMRNWGRHLDNANVALWSAAWVESDHGTIQEQLDSINELTHVIGKPQIMVLSGDVRPESAKAAGVPVDKVRPGKSVQAYWVWGKPETDWEKQYEAERLLILATGGDPAIATRARKMRALGVAATGDESCRIQTTIHKQDGAIDIDEFISRLRGYIAQRWNHYGSIDQLWGALLESERIFRIAKQASAVPDCVDAARTLEVYANVFRLGLYIPSAKEIGDAAKLPDALGKLLLHGFDVFGKNQKRTPHADDPSSGNRTPSPQRGSKPYVEGQTIPDGTIIHLRHGGSCQLRDMASQLEPGGKLAPLETCPIPGHVHDSPSVSVGMTVRGRLFVKCFGVNGGTWYSSDSTPNKIDLDGVEWVGEASQSNDNTDHIEVPPQQIDYTYINATGCGGTPWEHPSIPDESGVYLLSGPTGCGKTTRMVEATRNTRRVLVVSPTIALAHTASKIYGTTCYDSIGGQLTHDRLSVCGPSLLRVPVRGYDVVAIDEIEQVMGLIHTDAVMRRKNLDSGRWSQTSGLTWHRLRAICLATLDGGGRVVAGDAMANDRTVRELKRLCRRDVEVPIKAIKPLSELAVWKGITESALPDLGSAISIAVETIKRGNGVTIACDSQALVEIISALLGEIVRDDGTKPKILAIHSDTRDDWAGDVNRIWDAHDAVVFNQACGSGVSYTGTRHKVSILVGSAWGRAITYPMLLQLRHRNRVATERYSWVAKRHHKLGETDHGSITMAMEKMAEKTGRGWVEPMPDGTVSIIAADEEHFRSRIDDTWVKRITAMAVRENYYDHLHQNGVTVMTSGKIPGAQNWSKIFKDVRKMMKSAKVTAAMAAKTLLISEAHQFRTESGLTQQNRAELDRYDTLDRWGTLTTELVSDTANGGQKWKAAQRFVDLTLHVRERSELLEIRERNKAIDSDGGVWRGQMRHYVQRAVAARAVLKVAGIDPAQLVAGLRPSYSPFSDDVYGIVDVTMGMEPEPEPENHDGPPVDFPLWTTDSLASDRVAEKLVALNQRIDLGELLGPRFRVSPKPLVKPNPTDPFASHLPGGNTVAYMGRVLALIGIKTKRVGKKREWSIDSEALTEWWKLCHRQLDRAWGRSVPLPEDIFADNNAPVPDLEPSELIPLGDQEVSELMAG